MYDQVTWADIARYEQATDEAEQGVCEWCGKTDWLAPYGSAGVCICTDCEADERLRAEAQRIDDYDDGITWEDDR